MKEASTINKLIILYILDGLDFPISGSRLLEFVTDKQYMDYLSYNETLSGLIESELVSATKQVNKTEYSITQSGSETLNYFSDRVSDPIKKEVREFLKKNSGTLRDETSISTDYYRLTNGEYIVQCKINDKNDPLLDLKFSVPTEVQAQASAIKWKDKAQSVYETIMKELL